MSSTQPVAASVATKPVTAPVVTNNKLRDAVRIHMAAAFTDWKLASDLYLISNCLDYVRLKEQQHVQFMANVAKQDAARKGQLRLVATP